MGKVKQCASSLPRSKGIVDFVFDPDGVREEGEEEVAAGVDEDEDGDREFEFAMEEDKEEEGREGAKVRGVMDELIDRDDIEGRITCLFWCK